MKKIKIVALGLIVVLLLVVGVGVYLFLRPATIIANSGTSTPQVSESVVVVEDVAVPEDVTKLCSAKYWLEKDADGNLKDCKEYSQEMVCAYHRETQGKVSSIVNRQYVTECDACRSYGEEGTTEYGGVKYELLGFKPGECFQGVYKTNF